MLFNPYMIFSTCNLFDRFIGKSYRMIGFLFLALFLCFLITFKEVVFDWRCWRILRAIIIVDPLPIGSLPVIIFEEIIIRTIIVVFLIRLNLFIASSITINSSLVLILSSNSLNFYFDLFLIEFNMIFLYLTLFLLLIKSI